jgi:hypothetical protein
MYLIRGHHSLCEDNNFCSSSTIIFACDIDAYIGITSGMTGFAIIFSDFTNIASAKVSFFRKAFANELCRRAFAITLCIYTNLTSAKHLCRRAFAITFGIYTNLASAKHQRRRVFANSHGEPG